MDRLDALQRIKNAFQINPIVAILGPRQCGKTTLAKAYRQELSSNHPPENYFDLERPSDLARLSHNPELTFSPLKGLIIIDEIQRLPELFPVLRVLIDNQSNSQQYLILGSASRELSRQTAESLAGRISYLELTPFSYQEAKNLDQLWNRGGFPRSYLAKNDDISMRWREDYARTFLEQDIPNLGLKIPAENLRRFWQMLTHYHGNILNLSDLGNSLQLSHNTIRHYVDILTGTFMIRQLHPWFENIGKRQVKSPKIYFRDTGIFHTLLGVQSLTELWLHPKLGASWEGFALESIIRASHAETGECFFWATHGEAELDLLIVKKGKRLGFEIKYSEAPKLTRSMHTAIEILKLDQLTVVYPGQPTFPLSEAVTAKGLATLLDETEKLD